MDSFNKHMMRIAVLNLIEKVWSNNPMLRLTQLIGNCFERHDLYYVEDDMLIERLNEVYLKEKKDASKKESK